MTIQKQHETLKDMFHDLESLRNNLSHVRFENRHIPDFFFADIASSIEELAKDLVNTMEANKAEEAYPLLWPEDKENSINA
jgi:hypothetical protein